MPDLRFIHLTADDESSLQDQPDYRAAMASGDWAALAAVMQRCFVDVEQRPTQAATPDTWGGCLAVETETGTAVGSCGFKGPPDAQGHVEIAYLTYPGYEGQGHATRMAQHLIQHAAQRDGVSRIIAHTLPEPNASTRVLEKAGMTKVGGVKDPDDGAVWRWEMRL